MYRILFFLLNFLFFSNFLISQNFNSNGDYKPGELIIKFKDDVDLKINYKNNGEGFLGVDLKSVIEFPVDLDKINVLFNQKSVEASVQRRDDQQLRKRLYWF